MKSLFYKITENVIGSFRGYSLWFHLAAIISTYIIVVSGFDWKYFLYWRGSETYSILFSAAAVGGLFPVLVPCTLFVFGKIRKDTRLLNAGFALGQAALIGIFISSLYKTFTGRLHPSLASPLVTDITHTFQFGFLRGGIFWGWPSSHTTIAFAMACTLFILYKENKIVKILAIIYALYIGIGVSMTIHWFSDFVAGAIIGTAIGIAVGKSFRERFSS
jgi:membrane-associated phospholipid phosphatase